jgi:hypothetical protein
MDSFWAVGDPDPIAWMLEAAYKLMTGSARCELCLVVYQVPFNARLFSGLRSSPPRSAQRGAMGAHLSFLRLRSSSIKVAPSVPSITSLRSFPASRSAAKLTKHSFQLVQQLGRVTCGVEITGGLNFGERRQPE